ncbi:MAG: RsmF rRNA methyltransferase first C-terminal domain-containing protein [Clostridia bacterium]|nr:RsmF rRNA methyltransferase first C-terminal domain-containing protein [Clostridia bacterium]
MLPEAFVKRMKQKLGDEYAQFESALSRPPQQAMRLNPFRENAYAACAEYVDSPVPWEAQGYYVKEGARPGSTLLHAAGAFYMQDASAMAPVNALDVRPDDCVLDLCAAPGGKSGQLFSRLGAGGLLISNEYVKNRAGVLKSNLERLGYSSALVTNASAESFAALGEAFDVILVDAPCSGEGMFRKNPDAISEWSEDAPELCARRQALILDAAAVILKAGGQLVYSTCTFNETENEETISAFLDRHPNFEPGEFELRGVGKSQKGCLRLWPHKLRGEGHFVCLLRKTGAPGAAKIIAVKQGKAEKETAQALSDACLTRLPEGVFVLKGDELILKKDRQPDLRGTAVLSDGLHLGTVKGKRVEPAHALAMALKPADAQRAVELTPAQAVSFLQGEELPLPSEAGWTLVCFRNMPLGWAKSDGSVLKNHLPKGLRLRGGHTPKA